MDDYGFDKKDWVLSLCRTDGASRAAVGSLRPLVGLSVVNRQSAAGRAGVPSNG